MVAKTYRLSPLARDHLRAIRRESRRRFGVARTTAYFHALHAGLDRLAGNFGSLPARAPMTGGTGLRLHHIGSHYTVFVPLEEGGIHVLALLHERMDIPARLAELAAMGAAGIAALRAGR